MLVISKYIVVAVVCFTVGFFFQRHQTSSFNKWVTEVQPFHCPSRSFGLATPKHCSICGDFDKTEPQITMQLRIYRWSSPRCLTVCSFSCSAQPPSGQWVGRELLSLTHRAEAHSEPRRQKDAPTPSSTAQSPAQLGSALSKDRWRNRFFICSRIFLKS